jgi:hypothetical protein
MPESKPESEYSLHICESGEWVSDGCRYVRAADLQQLKSRLEDQLSLTGLKLMLCDEDFGEWYSPMSIEEVDASTRVKVTADGRRDPPSSQPAVNMEEGAALSRVSTAQFRALRANSPRLLVTTSYEPEQLPPEELYSKFDGGFEGAFASLSDFRGGLYKLLGFRPASAALAAMENEHCAKVAGFGASDVEFVTSNYGGNTTTPQVEWLHVVDPERAPPLRAGVDSDGVDLGLREKVPLAEFRVHMLVKIQSAFNKIGWSEAAAALTQAKLDDLDLTVEELIGVRLYTGPCFMLYNTVLRAMGNQDSPGIVSMGCGWDANQQWGEQNVRGCFTTTLHQINHGVIKLSWLSKAIQVSHWRFFILQ